jgi:hypothetical protein
MRYRSRLVIAVSMLVVATAVAHHPARAQDSESAGPAPELSQGSSVPVDGSQIPASEPAGPASEPVGQTPKPKRRVHAAPVAASSAPVEDREQRFGGPARADHRLQTGLWIMPGTGYRLIVPYKENQTCGDASGADSKRVCAHSVPIFLDFQLSFGAASRLDVILDLRFGLQQDPAIPGSHQFAVAPGLRFWLDQEVALKFFTTMQFVYDYTNFSNSQGQATSSSDIGVRNANGLMYDPIRNVGFFLQFGETIGFMRWFRIDLDVGIGAQIRFP